LQAVKPIAERSIVWYNRYSIGQEEGIFMADESIGMADKAVKFPQMHASAIKENTFVFSFLGEKRISEGYYGTKI
jgi:hypothetical protein